MTKHCSSYSLLPFICHIFFLLLLFPHLSCSYPPCFFLLPASCTLTAFLHKLHQWMLEQCIYVLWFCPCVLCVCVQAHICMRAWVDVYICSKSAGVFLHSAVRLNQTQQSLVVGHLLKCRFSVSFMEACKKCSHMQTQPLARYLFIGSTRTYIFYLHK